MTNEKIDHIRQELQAIVADVPAETCTDYKAQLLALIEGLDCSLNTGGTPESFRALGKAIADRQRDLGREIVIFKAQRDTLAGALKNFINFPELYDTYMRTFEYAVSVLKKCTDDEVRKALIELNSNGDCNGQ
jgi:hypothetical protein